VWRAALPGSWGFAHSPEWVMSELEGGKDRCVHGAAITALACLGETVVSSDDKGRVVFWQPLGDVRQVEPAHIVDVVDVDNPDASEPVMSLCADPQREDGIYAGLEFGRLMWLATDSEGSTDGKKELIKFDYGVSALEWDASSQALLIGLVNGTIHSWCPASGGDPREFGSFHRTEVRRIALTRPPASADVPRVLHLVSSGADGRVGVWDLEAGEPLWGLQNLPNHVLALGDHSRLVCSGCVINEGSDGRHASERSFSQSWKDPLPSLQDAPTCEAVLCLDLLGDDAGAADAAQEVYWPGAAEKSVSVSRPID